MEISSTTTSSSSEGGGGKKRKLATTTPTPTPRKKMTKEDKHMRSKERFIKEAERLLAWGCFDEIIPGNSFLKCLCRLYESWAYDISCNNQDENAPFPTVKEWVTNKDAMIKIKHEQFNASYEIGEPTGPVISIEIGFIGYIKCLEDKHIIKKAKAAILEWQKQENSEQPSLAPQKADRYWKILQCNYSLGAQIVRELKENKNTIIAMLSSEN